VSTPIDPPPGCRIAAAIARLPVCAEIEPPLVDVGGDRQVACQFVTINARLSVVEDVAQAVMNRLKASTV
jgi:hypothetical protein